MTDAPGNRVLRYLRRLDEKLDRVERTLHEQVLAAAEDRAHTRVLAQTNDRHEDAFATMRLRLDRIERRLDLNE